MNQSRQHGFQRNASLEDLLCELNARLGKAEAWDGGEVQSPQYPVVLVIGAPRSGTTLMMQWLANSGYFGYPTNLLSRFYAAPTVGAMIQQLLYDPKFNYKDELKCCDVGKATFGSDLGKTRGPLEPNEFWYFWRRFFEIDQARRLSDSELEKADGTGFLSGLAALESVFGKPWAMKGILLQYNLQFLDWLLPRVLFVFTQRDLHSNARSLLNARRKYFGDERSWFSVEPPGSNHLRELDPLTQVVGQIEFTNHSIRQEMKAVDPDRWLNVHYEDFCRAPEEVFRQIRNKVTSQEHVGLGAYRGPEKFEIQNADHRDDPADATAFAEAERTVSALKAKLIQTGSL